MRGWIVAASALLLGGCGSAGGVAERGEAAEGGPADGNGLLDVVAPAATFAVHVRANTATFPHQDGLSGETAQQASGGIRSLRLMRSKTDPSPAILFDLGAEPVEVGYNDGDDTLVATVDASKVPAGTYTLARLVQTHSRFRVSGTMHDPGGVGGAFDDLLVLSNGTYVDGAMRDAGHYLYLFEHASDAPLTFAGEKAHIAGYSTTEGASAVVENGEWAVYFPVALDVPASPPEKATLTIDVNMDRAFRWVDDAAPGFTAGVFDATPTSYEPVVRFGGNRFVTTLK